VDKTASSSSSSSAAAAAAAAALFHAPALRCVHQFAVTSFQTLQDMDSGGE